MATPDWGTIVQGDPGYGPTHAVNKSAILNLIRSYGSTAALSPELAAQYGITPQDEVGIDENPYSTVKNLMNQYSGAQYGTTNNAAAHGAEFSGAHFAALQHDANDNAQNQFNASQALNSNIIGVNASDASAYGSAIQNLMNNYVPPPTPPPTPPAIPAGPTNMQGTPVTFGPAGPGDKSRAPAYLAPPKPPKPPTPVGIHAQ